MAKKKTSHISKPNTPAQKTYLGKWQVIVGVAVVVFAVIIVAFARMPNSTIPSDFVPQVNGAPSVAIVSEPLLDHGDLVVNAFITSTFEIQNVGDEPLLILGDPYVQVHEGCCPPQAVISTDRLRPGEIATISMRYTMHAGMDGPHDLRIHLLTNDPDNREVVFTALSNWVS